MEAPPTIQFLGTGPYMLFSLGVAKYLREHFDTQDFTVLTSSGGAIAALAFLTLELDQFDGIAERLAQLFGSLRYEKWPLFAVRRVYYSALELLATTGTMSRLHNRLQIATTMLPFFQRRVRKGPFAGVSEVISLLESSAYIPTYFHTLPDRFEIDGGLSRSTTDPSHSLIVSPKAKAGVDVSMDNQRLNFLRVLTRSEILELYKAGYQRAEALSENIKRKISSISQNGGVGTVS